MRTRFGAIVGKTVFALLVPLAVVAATAATLLLAWNVLLRHGVGWALVSLVFGGPVIFAVARLITYVIGLPIAMLSEGIGRLVEPARLPIDPAVVEAARAAAERRRHALEDLARREEVARAESREAMLVEARERLAKDPERARRAREAVEAQLGFELPDIPPLGEDGLRTTGPLHLRHHFRSGQREG